MKPLCRSTHALTLMMPLFLGGIAIVACSRGDAGSSTGSDASTSQAHGGSGGTATGGVATGGSSSSGGAQTGGSTGGGGARTGGATSSGGASGGQNSGGTVGTGGVGAGGNATGGAATGGRMTGGATGTGGSTTGGATSGGGLATGGKMTGGTTGTGGSATGGTMTGGATGSGGSVTGGATSSGGNSAGGAVTGGNRGSGGTTGTGGTTASYRPCPTDGSVCKIMPFGDSITDGYGVAGGYRVELFRLAHQASKNITFVGSGSNGPAQVDGVAFPPNHEGHSGYTIDKTPSRSGISPLVSSVMPTYTPHIITLMIGTNDAIDDYNMATAPTRLGALIDSIFTQLPNVLLVVAQPIPSQDDALNLRLQTYNAAIPAIVKARADAGKHILVVDMYSVIAANANYKTALLQDTWHPNAAGHTLLGARWYAMLASSL
jgi:lysophospholipase L1-like esterase